MIKCIKENIEKMNIFYLNLIVENENVKELTALDINSGEIKEFISKLQ